MTWFTSHLALEGMIAFIFIGVALRSKFLQTNTTKALFLLANTFAIIPDLDVYLGIFLGNREHRGPSHSIFFPLLFVLIGLILFIVNYIQARKPSSPLADVTALFDKNKSNRQYQILYLLPYFFFLAAFFWGIHIVLDMDSAEGGMMLFWPLDNRLYQIQLIFSLDANPFLILPWRPLGASFDVTQSTVKGLYNYLFNWTPQDFINNFGTTVFYYSFVGLILHSFIFISWIFFVLRPMWPLQGVHISPQRTIMFRIMTNIHFVTGKITSYWHSVLKELLVPGIILIIIGFTFGPLVTAQVPDSQQVNGNLTLTSNTFNAIMFTPIDAISQPLDPNAHFFLNLTYQVNNVQTGEELYLILAPTSFFFGLQQQVNQIASTINSTNKPATDTAFKSSYYTVITASMSDQSIFYLETIIKSQTSSISKTFTVPSQDSYGIGFVLKNWFSQPNWNDLNTQIQITGNLYLYYSRDVNYWIGIVIESAGLVLVAVALTMPFIMKKKIKSI